MSRTKKHRPDPPQIFVLMLALICTGRGSFGIYNGHVTDFSRHLHAREVYPAWAPFPYWGDIGVYFVTALCLFYKSIFWKKGDSCPFTSRPPPPTLGVRAF